jgi:CheY-like chemotaxis protein
MPRKILLVDDEFLVGIGLKRNLEALAAGKDMQFDMVASAPDALAMLRQERYDAIITDYDMKPANGAELITEARKIPGYDKTPMFIRSARDLPTIRSLQPQPLAFDELDAGYFDKEMLATAVFAQLEKTISTTPRIG